MKLMLADSITKNPVCYATVYDANGTVIGRSDMGGCINLQKGFEYHISHISYEPKSLVYNEDSIIFLSPLSYKISEVNVTAKKKKYSISVILYNIRSQCYSKEKEILSL